MKDFEKEAGPAEHDLDAASEASSEPDYNYEFAQMEVIMKTLNSNGKMGAPVSSSGGSSYPRPSTRDADLDAESS